MPGRDPSLATPDRSLRARRREAALLAGVPAGDTLATDEELLAGELGGLTPSEEIDLTAPPTGFALGPQRRGAAPVRSRAGVGGLMQQPTLAEK